MGFSVAGTFDLLFAPQAGSAAWDGRYEGYEARRWFRRPAPDAEPPEQEILADVAEADEILARKVASCIPQWRLANKITVAEVEADAGGGGVGISEFSHSTAPGPHVETASVGEPIGGRDLIPPVVQLTPVRHIPPRMPYDVFAIAASLIEGAGVYHHLQPAKKRHNGGVDNSKVRHMEISAEDRRAVTDAALAWSSLDPAKGRWPDFARDLVGDACWGKLEPLFESWWIVFGEAAHSEVFERWVDQPGDEVPFWWKHVWRLFAISDEAAKGTAFQFDPREILRALRGEDTEIRWFEAEVFLEHAQRAPDVPEPAAYDEFTDITTLSIARQAVVNVLPKVRTSMVGCTLRSLSHHLALLPAAGVARGRWTPNYLTPRAAHGSKPKDLMNLLLVPFPYSLSADSFAETSIEDVSQGLPGSVPMFGYFDVHQRWITEDTARRHKIITFVEALVQAAKVQCPEVNGIIFPELSLDYETFELVRDHVGKHMPSAKILIAGTSSNEFGATGNFVAVASFEALREGVDGRHHRQTIREKHHRWKLDRQQLKDYGLLGVLSPALSWWENIALQNRRIDFTVLQRDSVLAAMICEDLARVDPCQQVIRSVGPNLVVALLMDAPQLEQRWPARYATVLAEDPGCAVLTLTSRGLMTRQHRLGIHRSSGDDRVVGLWRDDKSPAPIKLNCPYDAQAVLLSVIAESAEDVSLDGRVDREAKAWRYVGNVPIRVPGVKSEFSDILGAEDLACW